MNCPGDGNCPLWDACGGDYAHKVETMVCAGCPDCGGNPPRPVDELDVEVDDREVEEVLTDIEDIAAWETTGHKTDWSCYPYEYARLHRVWQQAVKDVENVRAVRFAAYVKALCK